MKRIAALVLGALLLLSLAAGCRPSREALLRQGIEAENYDLGELCEMVEEALLSGRTELQINYLGSCQAVERAVREGMGRLRSGLSYLAVRFLSDYEVKCAEAKGYTPTRIRLEPAAEGLLSDMPRQSQDGLLIDAYEEGALEALLTHMLQTKQQRALRLYERQDLDALNGILRRDLNIVMNTNYAYVYLVESAQWVLGEYTEEDGKAFLELDLSLSYVADTIPLSEIPVVNDSIGMIHALVEGWAAGEDKVTLILEGVRPDEETLFNWINAAEVNSAALACEGDSIWYEVLENPSERQIGRFWLEFAMDSGRVAPAQEQLSRAIKDEAQALREKLSDGTETEAAYRAVFDRVLAMTEYDDEIRQATEEGTLTDQMQILRSAYGALVAGRTVCTGYARAFQALCNELDLLCWTVNGYQDGDGHAWNMVRLGGETLYVDCTFADTSGRPDRYFLFTREQLEKWKYETEPGFVTPW